METVTCRQCGQKSDASIATCGFCGSRMPRRKPPAVVPGETPAPSASESPAPGVVSPSADGDPFGASATQATVCLVTGRQIVLQAGDRLMIGRGPDSPVADLCGDNVSREHATICVRDDGAYLQDRHSTNGTYLNEVRLEPGRDYRLATSADITIASDPPLRLRVKVTGS